MNTETKATFSLFFVIYVAVSARGNELGLQSISGLNSEIDSFGQESTAEVLPARAAVVNKRVVEFSDQFIKQDELPSSSGSEPLQEDIKNKENLPVTVTPVAEAETVNTTDNTTLNGTEESVNSSTLVSCIVGNSTVWKPVELVNSSRMATLLVTHSNITHRRMPAECVMLLFYARYCPFSSLAAPHFNALPRAFPDIKMSAIDAMKYHSFNTQYGIVGVPTVMLFHNGRPAAKFNDSDYTLEMFGRFITKYTGLEPKNKLFVMSVDFTGPVPSVPAKETDYCLILSWLFIVLCAVYYFSKSMWWQWIVEAVQNSWREAEAHHEHVE